MRSPASAGGLSAGPDYDSGAPSSPTRAPSVRPRPPLRCAPAISMATATTTLRARAAVGHLLRALERRVARARDALVGHLLGRRRLRRGRLRDDAPARRRRRRRSRRPLRARRRRSLRARPRRRGADSSLRFSTSADFADAAGFDADGGAAIARLRLGDVDGDGRADACARDGAGVALHARDRQSGFAARHALVGVRSTDTERLRCVRRVRRDARARRPRWRRHARISVYARVDRSCVMRASRTARRSPAPTPSGSRKRLHRTPRAGRPAAASSGLRLADVNGDQLADASAAATRPGIECAVSNGTELPAPGTTPSTPDFLESRGGWRRRDARPDLPDRAPRGSEAARAFSRPGGEPGLVCHPRAARSRRDGVGRSPRDNCPVNWNPGEDDRTATASETPARRALMGLRARR